MFIKLNPKKDPTQPVVYQIRLEGQLDPQWADWFGGMTISLEDSGETLLTGPVVDQAALHGLLKKVRDLGMPLISVGPVRAPDTQPDLSSKGDEMQSVRRSADLPDRKAVLSLLWIFATLNYVYADVFTLFFAPSAQAETGSMTAGAALGFAILMETAMAMVLLSRLLKYGVNRWANIIAGVIHTAAVAFTLFSSPPAPYYAFFAAVEILCTLGIIAYAWTWGKPEVQQG